MSGKKKVICFCLFFANIMTYCLAAFDGVVSLVFLLIFQTATFQSTRGAGSTCHFHAPELQCQEE